MRGEVGALEINRHIFVQKNLTKWPNDRVCKGKRQCTCIICIYNKYDICVIAM